MSLLTAPNAIKGRLSGFGSSAPRWGRGSRLGRSIKAPFSAPGGAPFRIPPPGSFLGFSFFHQVEKRRKKKEKENYAQQQTKQYIHLLSFVSTNMATGPPAPHTTPDWSRQPVPSISSSAIRHHTHPTHPPIYPRVEASQPHPHRTHAHLSARHKMKRHSRRGVACLVRSVSA